MRGKIPIDRQIRLNAYAVVDRAVEEGVACGLRRARKHLSYGQDPTDEQLQDYVEREVMNALCEVLQFHEDDE